MSEQDIIDGETADASPELRFEDYFEQTLDELKAIGLSGDDAIPVDLGAHYRGCAIEPIVYIEANTLGFHEGNIVKYVTRWRHKGGVDDLRKARYYIDRLIELAEEEASEQQKETQ